MVRVVSCRYMRISCSEDDHPLFRRYYARSNRERGVKLLRCFPHCCPEHVQRCYCGSSIHVLVTFAAEVSAATQGNLVICARFEPSRVVPLWPTNLADARSPEGIEEEIQENERKLQPGEVVSLPESILINDKRKSKQTVWIRGDREGQSKQKYESGVLFVLNNHRFPKWLYSYDSSVTRTQREMTHHLVVYVFQLTGSRSNPGEIDAAVLARHESPGFSLISYRRSGNNARDAGCDLPAIDVASSTKFAAVEVDAPDVFSSSSDDMEIDSLGWTSAMPSKQNIDELKPEHTDTHHGQPRITVYRTETLHQQFRQSQSAGTNIPEDKYSWQHGTEARNCDFREKGQHLLILWHFLQSILLKDVKICVETTSTHVRSLWLRAAASLRSSASNCSGQLNYAASCFVSDVFEHQSASPPLDKESAVLRITAHLFLRALSSHPVVRLVVSACAILSDTESNKPQLQSRFLLLISDLYDALDGVLREVITHTDGFERGNQEISLPSLIDEVLSLVYSQPRFRQLRAGVVALLMGQQAAGSLSDALNCAFQVFTAFARERMITRYREPRHCTSRHGDDDLLWSQRWLLEPGSVQILDVSNGKPRDYRHDLRLVDVVQLVSELGCVDITIEDDTSSLLLKSAVSVSGNASAAPMTLVLDGKLRLFRVLLSGVSSMITTAGGWSVGDYTATISRDGHSLEVNFFSLADATFPTTSRGMGMDINHPAIMLRRVCLTIRLEEEFNNGEDVDSADPKDLFAFVYGTVYGSTYSERMDELKLSEKPVTDRAATWSEVEWTPMWKLQAGYIALPRVGFV